MMTSVVADAARGNRDRAQPQTSHTSQPQATAEQIRLAQIIDKNDADFEGKVKQLIEVTGRNQDECMVALHDCHGDVNRAINFLLEEVIVTDSWETVGKKKSVGKEGATVETKERKVEKEGRGRGAPNRRSRGASRAQDGRTEENGFDSIPGERGERGRRGRGRGSGGRGRGRGDGVNRFSQGMGSLYTADYTGSADSGETAANNTTDGAGNWRNNLEDWAAEDWNEDLSETKVFTASFALASQSHATPGQGGDLSSLLPKGADVDSDLVGMERASPEPLTLSLVFTNSQQHATPTQAHRYASAAANSYASAAAGTYAQAASSLGPRPPQPDVLKTEPVSVSRITPVSSQPAVVQTNSSPFREACPTAAAPAPLALTEPKYEVPVTVTHMDLKAQPDPSPILSQLTQQQNSTLLSDLPAQGRNPSPTLPLRDTGSPVLKPLGETSAAAVAESHQPKQIRAQRRRIPPPSKIPSSAVEMPGSADVFGLNVQFGALDFASEPAVESTGQSEASIQEPDPPVAQTQSSMYSKQSAVSEPVTVLPPALPAATMEPRYTSPSMGLPTATAPTPSTCSRTESSSLQMEPTPISSATTLTNGFSDVQPSITQDAVPSSTPQSMAKALMSENGMAASTLPLCVSAAAPTPSTVLPSLSSHVSSGITLGAAVPASTGLSSQVASDVSGSLSAFSGSVLTSNGLSNGAPGLSTSCPSAPSTGRSAPLQTLTTTAKAPPNLPQGVPPLLANQYIMGPGGLLPAYPIYGFEDLQMMQSRLPIDYYGMAAFPGTALAARDGGLANNPYSGDATKYARGDAPSPAPTTSLSSVAPSQSEPGAVPPQSQAPQNPGQAFLNPPLPPGYGYTSLPYYTGMPGVPSAFQYGPTVFMPPASAKQHAQYQHQAGYGGHAYASGFDDMSQAHAGDYGKGYGSGTQSQAKSNNSTGKVPGLSGSAGSDLGTAVYSKTQGFSTVAPATFSLPSALGGTGPLNPGGAPGGYAPAPFLHILPPHQQPPSQILHHHIPQDTQGQRSQSSSMQKSQGKTSYNSSPYWAN